MKKIRLFIKETFKSKKGEGYVDTGVKILIAVVIGALLLSSLYALFNSTVMPSIKSKIESMFDYNGGSGSSGESGGTGNTEVPEIDLSELSESYKFVFCGEYHCDGNDVLFVSDGLRSEFKYLLVDGNIVSSEDYYWYRDDSNFAEIELRGSFCENLENGMHNIKFVFNDGYANGEFKKMKLITVNMPVNGTMLAEEGITWNEFHQGVKGQYDSELEYNGYFFVKPGSDKLYLNPECTQWIKGETLSCIIEEKTYEVESAES